MKLKRAHGNWVAGERFWNREAELDLLIEYLEEGAHLLIVAQRRIGKTSLMREAARHLEGRLIPLHVDLQKAHSPADAVVELSIATRPHAGRLTPGAALALAREDVGDGEKTKEEVREILGILEHDGYLRKTPDGSYTFLSNLLRDWWRGHFGFGYTPFAKRRP